MTSILESDYIKPIRPYSSNELRDMRDNFIKKLNLSNVTAYHKNCRHFYFVKENGRKEKELNENKDNTGNCSCCWKLSKIPKHLIQKAEDLVNIYSEKFNIYPSSLTYDLLDIEICFYKWLYIDNYDNTTNKNFSNNSQKKNLNVNTNV